MDHVVFLISEVPGYVTAQTIAIDDGWLVG